MNIAILGCGPAGLLVAHAAKQRGHGYEIFSKKRPSVLGGAQYLHRHIEGLTPPKPEAMVEFRHLGTQAGYASKIYDDPTFRTSWDQFDEGIHEVWNLRSAYERLWEDLSLIHI